MKYATINIANATQDVAEVRTITIGAAVEGEDYSASFGFATASVTAAGADDTDDIAGDLATAINSAAGNIVTASDSTNTVAVTADRAGVPIEMSADGPSTSVVLTTPAALAGPVDLTALGFPAVPEGGSITETIDLERVSDDTISVLKSMVKEGLVTINPPIDSLQSGIIEGDVAVGAGETLDLSGFRVKGDVTISATGTLTATDAFFEGDVDNSAGGTATLVGGKIIGTPSGSISHDAGDDGS